MLMDLGKPTYEEDFEKHFLAAAADFYAKEAQEFISTCNAPDYLRKVRQGSTVNDTLWQVYIFGRGCCTS